MDISVKKGKKRTSFYNPTELYYWEVHIQECPGDQGISIPVLCPKDAEHLADCLAKAIKCLSDLGGVDIYLLNS